MGRELMDLCDVSDDVEFRMKSLNYFTRDRAGRDAANGFPR